MSGYIGIRKVPALVNGSGIWTIREQAKFQKDVLWPALNDPYFANVSLLLHFEGANNSTTFTDSSANNYTVTRYGDTKISTAQSKWGNGSAYFDGNGDYLSIPRATNLLPTEDWTFEVWVYLNTTNSPDYGQSIFGNNNGSTGTDFDIRIGSTGNTSLLIYSYYDSGNTNRTLSANYTFNATTWYHIAVVRSGNAYLFFVNGSNILNTTPANTPVYDGTNVFIIGKETVVYSHFNGYLQDMRITKGVARYTSNFTSPAISFPNY